MTKPKNEIIARDLSDAIDLAVVSLSDTFEMRKFLDQHLTEISYFDSKHPILKELEEVYALYIKAKKEMDKLQSKYGR